MKTLNAKDKQILVAEMEKHQELDNIVQGDWFDDDKGKGCHIGCCGNVFGLSGGSANWNELSEKTGIPLWVLMLSERIFEGLPADKSAQFSIDFVRAIPVESNLDLIRPQIEIARLKRLIDIQNQSSYEKKDDVIEVLERCIDLWSNPHTHPEQWGKVESAAESAAWSARSAWSAAWSARSARSAAWSARSARSARSAWSAAESAAWSARSAWSAAESAAWEKEADTLLSAMRELG